MASFRACAYTVIALRRLSYLASLRAIRRVEYSRLPSFRAYAYSLIALRRLHYLASRRRARLHHSAFRACAYTVIAQRRLRYLASRRALRRLRYHSPLHKSFIACAYTVIALRRLTHLASPRNAFRASSWRAIGRLQYWRNPERNSRINVLRSRIICVIFVVTLSSQLERNHARCSPLNSAIEIVSEISRSNLENAWNSGKCTALLQLFSIVGTYMSVVRFILAEEAHKQRTKLEGLSGCYYALRELVRLLNQGRQFIDDSTGDLASGNVFTKFESSNTIHCLVSDLDNCVQLLVFKVEEFIGKNPRSSTLHRFRSASKPLCLSGLYLGHYLQLQAEKDLSHVLLKLKQPDWPDLTSWLSAGEESVLRQQLIGRLCYDQSAGGENGFLKHGLYVNARFVRPVKVLGSGSYGLVQEVLCFGKRYAMKTIKGMSNIEDVSEAVIHAKLQHPHIVKLIWYTNNVEVDDSLSLVMELLGKDLQTFIEQQVHGNKGALLNRPLVAVDIMLQIGKAMYYLHSQGIMHRDLKSANVLVDLSRSSDAFQELGYIHVKVADFGLAKVKRVGSESMHSAKVGTGYWRAPEVLWPEEEDDSLTRYSFSADVYSFSMTCYEILTGKEPFEDHSPKYGLRERIATWNERPVLPKDVHPGLTQLIEQCWDGRPKVRPTFEIICQRLERVKEDLLFGSCPSDSLCTSFGNLKI